MPARCQRPHTPPAHSRRSLSPASQPDAFPPGIQAHTRIHAPPCPEGTRVTAAPLAAERLTADPPLYTPPSSAKLVSESSTQYLKPLQVGVSTQRVPPVRAARSARQAPRDRVPRSRYSVPLGAARPCCCARHAVPRGLARHRAAPRWSGVRRAAGVRRRAARLTGAGGGPHVGCRAEADRRRVVPHEELAAPVRVHDALPAMQPVGWMPLSAACGCSKRRRPCVCQ